MPRTFTNAFQTAAASKSAKPYLVLQIDWGGDAGTAYYLDRPSDSFKTDDGNRIPSSGIGSALVTQWPSVGILLKESQIGATDQCSVVLDDHQGEMTAILNAVRQQRRKVTLWRMFDDESVTWSNDAAEVFTGCLRPFDWKAQDNAITLNIGDLGPLLAKDISCIASDSVFGAIPAAYRDRNIPLCWGYCQRVEAVLVAAPWETKITQSFNSGNPVLVKIADHPSDLPGVNPEVSYTATLGTDPVNVTFHQSADPLNTPSTATINVPTPVLVANSGADVYDDGSWQPGDDPPTFVTLLFYYWQVQPAKRQGDLAAVVQSNWTVYISDKKGGVYQFPVFSLNLIPAGSSTWLVDVYSLVVQNNPISIDNTTDPPTVTTLWDIRDIVASVAFFPPSNNVNPWPTGTVLRSTDISHIYATSALPSRAVQRVEGYGTINDASGDGRKDFVVLGQITAVVSDGSSTETVTSDNFQVNLNASIPELGRSITTISFDKAPRDFYPNLDDNRLWITLQGVETSGDGTGSIINNPASVILEYLQNTHLMNVDGASIDAESFSNAASALSGYSVGFPQVEPKPGLQLLQELADQCNSILLFDQGKARLVVLSDTAGTIRATFDTNTNDNMLQGSLSTAETEVDALVNELVVKWTPFWDDKSGKTPMDVIGFKQDAIADFGRISRQKDIYIYWRRTDVEAQRDWWLNHWSTIFRTVKFTGFLDALLLQPGDWIGVEWIDGAGRNLFGGPKSMMVTKCTDTGKDGLVEIDARYPMFMYAE